MNGQNEQYLHALLNWADEVQERVIRFSRNESLKEWQREMKKWKDEIKDLIDSGHNISSEKINEIKDSGNQIVQAIFMSQEKRKSKEGLGIGEHKLPPLPYPYNALEPYISEEIMRLHHDVHHKSYVEGLNKAEKMIDKWSVSQNDSLLRHWMREQSFNGSGHFLHTIFWENMSPHGGGNPTGELRKQIKEDFSSTDRFKKLFTHAAKSVQGSGWAILVWELRSGRLAIQTAEKHNMFALWDVIPLLVLDVWEHAYYLQYETDRNKYIENWWNVVNWDHIEERFSKAKTITWEFA